MQADNYVMHPKCGIPANMPKVTAKCLKCMFVISSRNFPTKLDREIVNIRGCLYQYRLIDLSVET